MMIWKLAPEVQPGDVDNLVSSLSTGQPFPRALAEILVRRGIHTYEDARKFFVPDLNEALDPYILLDMEKAVERLLKAYKNQEKVLLYGDYDVDGTTAVALAYLTLRDLGFELEYYIPDRYSEGYGLSYQGIDFARKGDFSLIITLDCGIKAEEQVRYAAIHGIDLIICDHHLPGEHLPPAYAILDPKRPGDEYPNKELTGCGVGLKFMQAFVLRLSELGEALPAPDYDPFKLYGDLLVLSIACDIVSVTGENRLFAYHGLEKIKSGPLPGIKYLMDQDDGGRRWEISDLVFFLGPRINSAGRIEHGSTAVELLVGEGEEAERLAKNLHHANEDRKELDRQMTEEAIVLIKKTASSKKTFTTVLYEPQWHKGVIGIVASRLIESYYRPTVLLTKSDGKLVGSARSVVGYDLYGALEACDEHLLQWGGHKYAAGITMEETSFPAFKEKFDNIVASTIREDQLSPTLNIDAILDLEDVSPRMMRLLERMEPFGPDHRKPVFMTQNVEIVDAQILKEKHLRLRVEKNGQSFSAIGFNFAEKWFSFPRGNIDIAYQPVVNTWNQQSRIDLRLKDFRISQ